MQLLIMPSITIYHDLRRGKKAKDNSISKDVYPVKVRVYHDYQTKLYPTGKDLSEDQFKRSYLAEKPRGEFAELKDSLEATLARAKSVAKNLEPFSFVKFEKRFLSPSNASTDVLFQYSALIQSLRNDEQIKTAANYVCAFNSLKKFIQTKGKSDSLSFSAVNVKFLKAYEKWMISEGNSFTTISMYLRTLRTVFNTAIAEEESLKELYPFGAGKYEIPTGEAVKKALTKNDLQQLFNYNIGEDLHLQQARDFWFFSYLANGMNVRDICELKNNCLEKDRFSFIRTKTKRTSKRIKPIVVILTPFLKSIIEKYRNSKAPEDYVFPIFEHSMTEEEKVKKCDNFTRYINKYMRRLAKMADIDEDLTTYYARHSFTTISVQSGASLEFIQESLGHRNITTTQGYFAGFDLAKKIENAKSLSDFLLQKPTH